MSSETNQTSPPTSGSPSPGPTAEGQSRSATNARRHRFLSKCMVIEPEQEEYFDIVMQDHLDRFPELDGVELGMVEEMAVCHYRLRRIWAIEKVWMEVEIGRDDCDHELVRLANAFGKLAETDKYKVLQRYE